MAMSLEAERAVLGSLLNKPDLMDECHLQPKAFDPEYGHAVIMQVLRWAYEHLSGKPGITDPFDPMVLYEEWGDELREVGGNVYLMQLRKSVPSVANFNYYQNVVHEAYVQRIARSTISEAISSNGDIDITDIAEKMQQFANIQTVGNSGGPIKVAEVLDGHYKKVMARSQRSGMTGAKTASEDYDQMSGGHQKGDVIIIAARPSIGKTAHIVNDSTEAARGGGVALIFSAEMSAEDVSERHICSIGNIDSKKVRTGLLSETDWERYSKALEILDNLEIYIDDTAGMSIEYIQRKIKEFKKKFQNLTVYIDYLQLIETEKEFPKTYERVNYVSKKLKQIAKTFDVPVIAISSVGRKCEERVDKRPLMSDLRESGNIEFDADIIIFLYRDDYYFPDSVLKGVIELIVAKGRKIGTGTIQMVFNRKTGRFINLNADEKYKLAEKVRENEQQRKNRR